MVNVVDVFYSVVILLVSLAVAFVSWVVIKRYGVRVAAKTATPIDDFVVHVVKLPLFLSIILVGINLAVKRLGVLGEYTAYFDTAFYAMWTIIVGYIIYKFIDYIVPSLAAKAEIPKTPVEVIRKILKWITVAATLLVLIGIAGVDMGGIVPVIMIVLGTLILLAFAGWSIMSNIMAAMVLMIWRPMEVGDYVELSPDGVVGRIEDITLMFTRMRLKTGEVMNIPNTVVIQKYIRNLSKAKQYLIQLTYTATGGSNPDKTGKLLLKAAENTDGILKDPAPFYRIKNIDGDAITYEINAYTDRVEEVDDIAANLRLNILKQITKQTTKQKSSGE